jgi:hypothetical protein
MSTLLQERQQPITAPRLRDGVAAQRATPRASASHQPAATVPNCPVEAPRALARYPGLDRRDAARVAPPQRGAPRARKLRRADPA